MKVQELGHAVLYVRDVERSSHFYGDLLGLPRVGEPWPGAVAFSGGRTHHELLLIQVDRAAAPIPPAPRVGLYHLGFKIGTTDDELAGALAGLRGAGVPIVGTGDHTVTHSIYVRPRQRHQALRRRAPRASWQNDPGLVMAPTTPSRS
jgi:catechol-2,3-dioxygenase